MIQNSLLPQNLSLGRNFLIAGREFKSKVLTVANQTTLI